jgi:hypothetical protein
MWNVKSEMWNVKSEMWNVKSEMWNFQSQVKDENRFILNKEIVEKWKLSIFQKITQRVMYLAQ